jgi:hypothetical protein
MFFSYSFVKHSNPTCLFSEVDLLIRKVIYYFKWTRKVYDYFSEPSRIYWLIWGEVIIISFGLNLIYWLIWEKLTVISCGHCLKNLLIDLKKVLIISDGLDRFYTLILESLQYFQRGFVLYNYWLIWRK